MWVFVLTIFVSLVFSISTWFTTKLSDQYASDPFLQVTNREFSIFLWQFPEKMRINAKTKTGYLPAFEYLNGVGVDPELADKYVIAPPETLFLFHTWNRFLRPEMSLRPIPVAEFQRFLKDNEQWQPQFWKDAPPQYLSLVERLDALPPEQDLLSLPAQSLPLAIKQSFTGWKNYFSEGDQINTLLPSYAQLEQFLAHAPHYKRSYWRNILKDSYPNYLKDYSLHLYQKDETVPKSQMAPFLKVEMYNFFHQTP